MPETKENTMPQNKTHKASAGIEKLKTSIRIWWRIDGTRYRETLHNTPPTAENCKDAQAIADAIATQLQFGTFDRDAMFPNSPKRKEAYFGFYITQWEQVESNTVAISSWKTYKSKVENHIRPVWSAKQIAKIKVEDIEYWVYNVLIKQKKLSSKTIQEILTLWQKIWSYWARHQAHVNNPCKYIKLTQTDPEDINPFTQHEIRLITQLETNPTLKNLWTVMLWSGLSSHELLPLAIEDINLDKGVAYISRGFVRGEYRVTKNRRRKRQIELLPVVTNALRSQIAIIKKVPPAKIKVTDRDHRTIKQQELHFLWYSANLGTHHNYEQLRHIWKKHLNSINVPYRPLNNGRHTYASQVLSTGVVSAEWLANQLGHANTGMIHKHYGKFIPDDSKHIIRLLDQALTNI